jgi:hypothetical protein
MLTSYLTRMMRSRDPRFRRIAEKMGHQPYPILPPGAVIAVKPKAAPTKQTQGAPAQPVSTPSAASQEDADLSALREEYRTVVGKIPFYGWDADVLRAKIAEKRAAG